MKFSEIIDKIRKKLVGANELSEDPKSNKFTFINDEEKIRLIALEEARIWYVGNSNELLNFYTAMDIYGFNTNPIYNRNYRDYFWSISSAEANIKRTHSGLAKAMIDTMSNVVGTPEIKIADQSKQELLDEILESADFKTILLQEQMPLTLAEGYGAFKINVDKSLSNHPIFEFVEGLNVKFIVKSGKVIGVIFNEYYNFENDNYVLVETRQVSEIGSEIRYNLYRMETADEVTEVPLSTIPQFKDLNDIVFPNYKKLLAIPCVIFKDENNKGYGKSWLAGKIDLLDSLDQVLSQQDQTVRVSTPVEYYDDDIIERDGKTGKTRMPSTYNRQYLKKIGQPINPDGTLSNQGIQTTQPDLHFDQYGIVAMQLVDNILMGKIANATMGIDVGKRDNAEAQREKEKTTLFSRNTIIDRETPIIKDLVDLLLDFDEYMQTGFLPLDSDNEITVTFNEFANPSFETELAILGPAYNNGQISTEQYVRLLYRGKLSEEETAKEIAYLEGEKTRDTLTFGDFDETTNKFDNRKEEKDNRRVEPTEE